jgi:hypothetical protein
MKQKVRGVGVGTVSLVMIFAVLCLTVFAMLTLSTSNAEKSLAERTAAFVTDYYEADTKATKIRAEILDAHRSGFFDPQDENFEIISVQNVIDGVEFLYERSGDDIFVTYSCEVNDVLNLSVKLRLFEDRDIVLEWNTVHSQEWEMGDGFIVWDGEVE